MSLAKKCDICGKLYEDYEIKVEGEEVNALVLVCTDEDDHWSNSDDATDCCPKCMRSILRHIKSLRPTMDSSNSEMERTCATCKCFHPYLNFRLQCSECDGNYNLWEPKEQEKEEE